METGVDLLHIGLLHGLHHQNCHFLRGGVLLGLLVADGEGAGTVAHDEILPIVRLMMQTVPGRLHLLPAHIRHIEGTPRGPYRFAGLQVIRGGRRGLLGQLRLILPARLLRKGQHLVHMGLVRVLDSLPDHRRVYIEKFLIAGGVFELLDLGRQIVLLGLPQGGQLLIQGGNVPGHQVFIDFFFCCVLLRVLGGVLRVVLAEELVHIVGNVHRPLGFFFLGQLLRILESHHPVFFRDTVPVPIVHLVKVAPGIPHIPQVSELAALLQGDVPAVDLIVDVVPQMFRHLHGVQLLDVIPAQVVVVMDVGVNVVAVQVLGQVDDLLQAARMVADLHSRLELFVLALAHLVQLGGQVVELVQVLILAQFVIEAVHIAVIVGDEPLLIGLAEVVLLPNADPFKHLLHLLRRGGELHPFAHQVALVVLAQVGDEGGKGIILVIFIMGHIRTSSLQLRLRLPLVGRLGLILVPALLFALFQPLLDGGLAVRLLRLGAVVLPWVVRGEQIPPAGEAPPVLLQGAPAEGGGVNGGPQVIRQVDGQFLVQILPSQILQGLDMGLQYKAVYIFLKFQELLRRGQPERGLLHSGQQVPVLRGEGGNSFRHRRQLLPAHILFRAAQGNIRFTFCHSRPPSVWGTPA